MATQAPKRLNWHSAARLSALLYEACQKNPYPSSIGKHGDQVKAYESLAAALAKRVEWEGSPDAHLLEGKSGGKRVRFDCFFNMQVGKKLASLLDQYGAAGPLPECPKEFENHQGMLEDFLLCAQTLFKARKTSEGQKAEVGVFACFSLSKAKQLEDSKLVCKNLAEKWNQLALNNLVSRTRFRCAVAGLKNMEDKPEYSEGKLVVHPQVELLEEIHSGKKLWKLKVQAPDESLLIMVHNNYYQQLNLRMIAHHHLKLQEMSMHQLLYQCYQIHQSLRK